MHLSLKEDTAKPLVSVAMFRKNTTYIMKIRASLLEADEKSAVNLDPNADNIFPYRIYIKRWKDPDRADARHIKVKEELETVECYSIELKTT